jgi:hypothetical protein
MKLNDTQRANIERHLTGRTCAQCRNPVAVQTIYPEILGLRSLEDETAQNYKMVICVSCNNCKAVQMYDFDITR